MDLTKVKNIAQRSMQRAVKETIQTKAPEIAKVKQAGQTLGLINKSGPAPENPQTKTRPSETPTPNIPALTESTDEQKQEREKSLNQGRPTKENIIGNEAAAGLPKYLVDEINDPTKKRKEEEKPSEFPNAQDGYENMYDPALEQQEEMQNQIAQQQAEEEKKKKEKKKKNKIKFPIALMIFAILADLFGVFMGIGGLTMDVLGFIPWVGVVFKVIGIGLSLISSFVKIFANIIIFGWSKVYKLENYKKAGRVSKFKQMIFGGLKTAFTNIVSVISMIPFVGFLVPAASMKIVTLYLSEKIAHAKGK